ncbi:hypothetical protein ES708_00740 [subsurface metagenome]
MSRFLTEHIYKNIDNVYVELTKPLKYQSDLLKEHGYKDDIIEAPIRLVHDLESVPRYIETKYGWLSKVLNILFSPVLASIFWLLSNTSKRGGTIHDCGYRKDFRPEIPKEIWDLIYLEIMELRNNKKWKRAAKYKAVKWFGKGSYNKFNVDATYEEITG